MECATLGAGFQLLFVFIGETLKREVTRSILCLKLSSKKTAHPEMSGAMGVYSALGIEGKGEFLISLVLVFLQV